MSALDAAHAAMIARPDDDGPLRNYYARVAEVELVLLLDREAEIQTAEPRVFSLETGPTALAFDSEERLADFAGAAPYVAVPGRRLAQMLAGRGVFLGLNFGDTPSAHLLTPEILDWMADALPQSVVETSMGIVSLSMPRDLPDTILSVLDAKLARAGGLAETAILAGAEYANGTTGHILAILNATPGSENALVRDIAEALHISGVDPGKIDVTFAKSEDAFAHRLKNVGLRFDLPATEHEKPPSRDTDRDLPPRLR